MPLYDLTVRVWVGVFARMARPWVDGLLAWADETAADPD